MRFTIMACVISYYITFVAPTMESILASINYDYEMTEEDISDEIRYGDMELLAQLIQAEAGNQDLDGMRLVADVVMNRVDSPAFPDTVEEVIFQINPTQFSVTKNGAFEKAGWEISENAFLASDMEYEREDRLDPKVLYFNNSEKVSGKNKFKHGDHWFAY